MKKVTKLIETAGLVTDAGDLSKEAYRETVIEDINEVLKDPKPWTDDKYVINLGKPTEAYDSNMVDEGAMTSVLYYNDLRDKSSVESDVREKA